MKATELMVGNIVKHPEGYTMTVFGIKGGYATGVINVNDTLYDSQQKIKNLSPIPITEELLVRIGLKRENVICSEKYFFKNIPNYTIVVKNYSNTIGRDWSVHIDNDDADSVADVDIQYLHQLQNLLNIMNIKLDFVV